ncbi:unnamed protein product [Oikopleura dioica]|nr:unnamed protein product [Oikopleura dioica]
MWKTFAKENPQLNIQFFKFEEILADKAKEISKLVDFLEIKKANIAEIIQNSEIKKAREHRQKESEKLGIPFAENALFRQGSSKGWKNELSEETLAFYESLK